MRLIFRRLSIDPHPIPQTYHRRFASFDATNVQFVRDRGLDHAVEREGYLRPVINLKNLLKSEPTKSLPLSVISDKRHGLQIPIRPIEFLRKYPSIFEEFSPGGVSIHPHFKLKGEVLELDAEENLNYQREDFKKDAAARVLKLLMVSRVHKIPISLIDRLHWDLGLPQDFVQSIVPEFPDHFRVVDGGDSFLELVCWKNELATSVVEKKGSPVNFGMHFSKGFEMDKKFKKWIDEWQKLPYISPYEDGTHLGPNSDESDKWATSVLHEILHLFVSKKCERDNVLLLGDYLGIRSRFKRALLNHPGIFYLSRKIGTYTVVLKEAFKRGSLIQDHSIMTMRSRYLHLMNMVNEEPKVVTASSSSNRKKKKEKKEEETEVRDDAGSEFEDDDTDEDDDDVGEAEAEVEAEAEDEAEEESEDEDAQSIRIRQKTSTKIREGTRERDWNTNPGPIKPNRGREGTRQRDWNTNPGPVKPSRGREGTRQRDWNTDPRPSSPSRGREGTKQRDWNTDPRPSSPSRAREGTKQRDWNTDPHPSIPSRGREGTKQRDWNTDPRPSSPSRGREGTKQRDWNTNPRPFSPSRGKEGTKQRDWNMNPRGRPVSPGRGREGRPWMNESEKNSGSFNRKEFHKKSDNFRARSVDRSSQPRSKGWSSV